MSKKHFKTQAKSSRAGGLGQISNPFASSGTGVSAGFGSGGSPLSYLAEQPDLTLLSDANVVVSFKNLSKKDSTTKTKALEELQAWISPRQPGNEQPSSTPPEDAYLDAWVKVYPRISIDVSRRVRQLAHVVHGQTCAACGKRIARHMPAIIGAWLAGLYDGDKTVSLAARSALNDIFSTPEKQDNLLKVYQSPLAEFARDAILKETPATLSDERTTIKEDSEAKYHRVVAGNLAVLTSLLVKLDGTEIEKSRHIYEEVVSEKSLWKSISSPDAQVRRSLMRLVRVCLDRHRTLLAGNEELIRESFLGKTALRAQTLTSAEFVETMTAIATSAPDFWASSEKLTPLKQLRLLLEQGSHSGPLHYWDRLVSLFQTLPKQEEHLDPDQVQKVLGAMRTGMTKKDEPRSFQENAWSSYVLVCNILIQHVPSESHRVLLESSILPAIKQYLHPQQERANWTIHGSRAASVIAKMFGISGFNDLAQETWPVLAAEFVERIQTSLPEQSKEFAVSQDAVRSGGERWFQLQKQALQSDHADSLKQIIESTTHQILQEAIQVLQARNGKPYGAAAAINAALSHIRSFVDSSTRLHELVASILVNDTPNLLFTPSGPSVISALYQCQHYSEFENAWKLALEQILNTPDGPSKTRTLYALLDPNKVPQDFRLATANSDFQAYVLRQVHQSISSSEDLPQFLGSGSLSAFLATKTTDQILSDLAAGLTIQDKSHKALKGIEQIGKGDRQLIRSYVGSSDGSVLLQNLLRLTESPDDSQAEAASAVNRLIQDILASDSSSGQSSDSILSVIERGLYDADASSISVQTLADLALQLFSSSQAHDGPTSKILPDTDRWHNALLPFLTVKPRLSLAITNPLGGAIYLTDGTSGASSTIPTRTGWDSDGFSSGLRIALYLLRIATVQQPFSTDILIIFAVVVQLANDELGLRGANRLWTRRDADLTEEVSEFISDGQRFIKDQLPQLDAETFFSSMQEKCLGKESAAFYTSRVYVDLVEAWLDEGRSLPQQSVANLESQLRGLRKDGNIVSLIAHLTAHSSVVSNSSYVSRLCNECIADLTGLDVDARADKVLQQLVVLNAILANYSHLIDSVAKQRVVFFVKHVIPWLESSSTAFPIRAELCKALTALSSSMSDTYGEHWQSMLDALFEVWSSPASSRGKEDEAIPLYHASLKLFNALGRLSMQQDVNEDLQEAWAASGEKLSGALLSLLTHLAQRPDQDNQPLGIVNSVLAKQIAARPPTAIEHPNELYSLLAAESSAVQHTAYEILHRQIPKAQEQISLDAALDNITAKLPEELLSLLLDIPPSSYDGASFDRSMPPAIRTYLSSWLLVFDHLAGASDRVRGDYSTQLKDGGHLDSLLMFIFTFLGHADGRPIDASKFDVATYDFDLQESPVQDVQWLLSHLYFLCLRYLSTPTKTWWLDSKSRQIRLNVESWTEKYISPHIIASTLDAVAAWAATQDQSSDEALEIKTNQRTREVAASKDIDGQLMTMLIQLPDNFPLGQAAVVGQNRVAVEEKRWLGWQHNLRGVIAFSGNSLVDGIVSFRRNVAAALKGQTECAICYSLVSADRQLPTKRCQTCKNAFHASCLYRWFKSSNSSSCPLCRTSFNYG